MRIVLLAVAGTFCICCASCTNYRIHLKVLPEDTYNVFLNDYVDKGATDSAGEKDIVLEKVYTAASQKITVRNKTHSGYAILDAYEPMLGSKYVDSFSVKKGPNGERDYNIRFLVDRRMYNERHAAPRPAPRAEPMAERSDTGLPSLDPGKEIIEPRYDSRGRRILMYAEDNVDHARKLAVTGAACFFVGMGLNYSTAFIPLYNPGDTTPNIGNALASLGLGLTGSIMQIAGTSYAVGGAKLAWELGRGSCEESKEPFTLWGPYKAGWAFVAIGGVVGVIGNLVQTSDRSAATTVAIIGLGLQIGRDVCWSIANVKASAMTRKVKECLEEQKAPAHHMRFELEPRVTRGGAGLRCSLLL